MREALKRNWNTYLRLPDDSVCCKKMMLKIYNCSPSLIYGDRRERRGESNSQGEANSLSARIATSVASWLHLIKATADAMPDEGWYQINTPLRSMVFENYNADAEENNLYVRCKSKSYFLALWHQAS